MALLRAGPLRVALAGGSVLAACVVAAGMYWITRRTSGSSSGSEALHVASTTPKRQRTAPVLSKAARRYIWYIEGKAFQINHKAGPLLGKALSRGDRDAVVAFFAADFQGRVFSKNEAEQVQRSFAEFQFLRAIDHSNQTADREQFADWLLGFTQLFHTPPGVQLALLHLNPKDPDRLDGAWQGTWLVRWFGENEARKPGEVFLQGEFVAEQLPSDFARDRGWISSWNVEQASVAQASHVLMEDATARCGIDVEQCHDNWKVRRDKFDVTPGGAYACDYNGDGITDLLVTDKSGAKLYAGRGEAKFDDMTTEAGLAWETLVGGVTVFADLDNDADEDLILGTSLLENRDGKFMKRSELVANERGVGGAVADYDRDGLVDLYVSYAAPGPIRSAARTSWVDDQSGEPNRLWRNQGNFRFENVTEQANAAAGRRSTFTSLWLDADEDGWPDIYVINELGPNLLLRNEQNGTFSERHVGPEFDGFTMGAAAGDMDGDGRIDLYLGNMFSKAGIRIVANVPQDAYPAAMMKKMRRFVAGNSLLCNRGSLQFEEITRASVSDVGWAYGASLVDLDGDGLLDIHCVCGFASFSRDEPDG